MANRSKARGARIRFPLPISAKPGHLKILEKWMRSYGRKSCSMRRANSIPELAELAPSGERRMGANPHANGGLLLKDLVMPDFREYAVKVPKPGDEIDGSHARPRKSPARCHEAAMPTRRTSGYSVRMRRLRTGSTRYTKSPTKFSWSRFFPPTSIFPATAA